MLQVLFEVPGIGLKLYGFGLMLCLAFLASMAMAAWRARREGLDPETVYDLALWLIVGGLVGARGFFVIQHREAIGSPWEIFAIWKGGIVYYGSVIGGLVAFLIYYRLRPFPMRPMLDAIAPSLALGTAIGRVGCFLNGCCYGDACSLPWAVRFPAGTLPWADQVRHGLIDSVAPESLAVHPTQLYSAIDGLILLALLSAFYPLRRRDGEVMGLLMVAYPITRCLIEWLRNDEGAFVAGLTISQAISVLLLAVGALYWAWLARLPRVRHADGAADPAAVATS